MAFTTITDDELVGMGVTGLPDTPELSTEDMQAQFDEYSVFLKNKLKTHITELEANTAAADIGMTIPESLTNVETEKVQDIVDEIAARVQSQKDWQDAADGNFHPAELNTDAFHADDTTVTVPTVATNDDSTNAASTANVNDKIDAFDTTITNRIAQNTFAATVGATVPSTLPNSTSENTQAVMNAIAAEAHANTAWRGNAEEHFDSDKITTDVFYADNSKVEVPTVSDDDVSNKAASTEFVNNKMQAIGAGDMAKSTYDPNNRGVVETTYKVDDSLLTSITDSTASYPVPAANESVKVIVGKIKKFLADLKGKVINSFDVSGTTVTYKDLNGDALGTFSIPGAEKGVKLSSGKFVADLKDDTASSLIATAANSSSSDRMYPVELDANGNLGTNVPMVGGVTCDTAAGTAAKVAKADGFALKTHSRFTLILKNANSMAGALTLNVNGTGAKAIYINGVASSSTNYTLPAGAYEVYYDGTHYHIRTDGYRVGSDGNVLENMIAPIETRTDGYSSATRAYGSYFVYNGLLYKVTASNGIASGAQYTSSNCEATNTGDEFTSLKSSLTTIKKGDNIAITSLFAYGTVHNNGTECSISIDLGCRIADDVTSVATTWSTIQTYSVDGARTTAGVTSKTISNRYYGKLRIDSGINATTPSSPLVFVINDFTASFS